MDTITPKTQLTIGIVTISYNQAIYLQDAIDSVCSIDPSRLRYVIVDAGSTDGSREMISRQAEKFSKIVFEPDEGPSDGLNKGFAQCDGDILGYINSDDRIVPGALQYVLDYFEAHSDVNIIMGGIREIDKDGKPSLRKCIPTRFTLQDYLDGTCRLMQQSTFYRRSAWAATSGFNKNNGTCWDAELLIDMMLNGERIHVLPKMLADFRLYPESISGSGRLLDKYRVDGTRIRQKIKDAGIYPTSGYRSALKWLGFKLHLHANPVVYLSEVMAR